MPFVGAQSALDYIQKADKYRGSENWSFDLKILDFEEQAGKVVKTSDSEFKVIGQVFASEGNRIFKSICSFLSPASEKGKKMLMDGQIYWMFFPDAKNLVRITPAQRLAGQATASDIASINYENDYTGELVGEEKVLKHDCVKLKLKQKNENVAYESLNYWVEKGTFKPIKVEYFGAAGKHLKTGYYRDFKVVMGKEQAHELFLVDPIVKGRVTKMLQSNKAEVKMPEYAYRKESFVEVDISQKTTELNPMDILASADKYRGAESWGFELKILDLQSESDKKVTVLGQTDFLVTSKIFGKYPEHVCRTFVQFTAPANEKDKKMLMDGQIYWMFFPDTKNLVRITPAQRLAGQATAADIASVNFTADYTAVLAGEESVLNKACYKLKLSPKHENIAYASLNYWVEKGTFQPVKVEYFSVAGKLLKTSYFRNFKMAPALGGVKTHEMFIIDPLKPGHVTRMIYSNLKPEDRPEYFFRKDGFAEMSLVAQAKSVNPLDIIQGADQYRGGENWGFDLEIVDFQEGADKKVDILGTTEFIVTSRTFKEDKNIIIKSLCKFTKPESTIGQKMLMDGQIYWMFFPNTKNLVRITPAQRLAGQATAADIASTNFTYDYNAEFAEVKEEAVLGHNCYKMVLSAKPDKEVAYAKLAYWVEKETLRPIKIEYFASTGKHLKTAYYRDFKDAPKMGKVRAHELYIVDPVTQGHVTRMRYSNLRPEESPEYIFRKEGLTE